jgi:hypothetical protein
MLPRWLLRGVQQLNVIFGLGFSVRVSRGKPASQDRLILSKNLPVPTAGVAVLRKANVEVRHDALPLMSCGSQAGARSVSQPPTPGTGPLSVIHKASGSPILCL